jgi:hypothetical protein
MGRDDLIGRAEIKAAMIEMGEKIAWGSDSAIIRELAAALKAAEADLKDEQESCGRHYDMLQRVRTRAEQAEADLAAARAEIERLKEGLRPFAEAANFVAENHPGWDHDRFNFELFGLLWIFKPFRIARALLAGEPGK